ncbi:hypothetical protein L484_012910 [Morus notabilis]|uniref:Uncharacterized protein n=1 Tax=Morus notabilis TaxID=981085 RepID=W9RDB9_9ROSA|nr:hypothetical protein L484_012910 [Morus notabilis]
MNPMAAESPTKQTSLSASPRTLSLSVHQRDGLGIFVLIWALRHSPASALAPSAHHSHSLCTKNAVFL